MTKEEKVNKKTKKKVTTADLINASISLAISAILTITPITAIIMLSIFNPLPLVIIPCAIIATAATAGLITISAESTAKFFQYLYENGKISGSVNEVVKNTCNIVKSATGILSPIAKTITSFFKEPTVPNTLKNIEAIGKSIEKFVHSIVNAVSSLINFFKKKKNTQPKADNNNKSEKPTYKEISAKQDKESKNINIKPNNKTFLLREIKGKNTTGRRLFLPVKLKTSINKKDNEKLVTNRRNSAPSILLKNQFESKLSKNSKIETNDTKKVSNIQKDYKPKYYVK